MTSGRVRAAGSMNSSSRMRFRRNPYSCRPIKYKRRSSRLLCCSLERPFCPFCPCCSRSIVGWLHDSNTRDWLQSVFSFPQYNRLITVFIPSFGIIRNILPYCSGTSFRIVPLRVFHQRTSAHILNLVGDGSKLKIQLQWTIIHRYILVRPKPVRSLVASM